MTMPHFNRLAVPLLALAVLATACAADDPDLTSAGASASATESDAPTDEAEGMLGELRERGVIRVANTQTNPPYSFVDESNEVVGFDVDIAEELASRMDIGEVEFVQGTFETFISGLQADKWDVVISGLTPTDERREVVDFTCPYQVNALSLFVAEGNDTIQEEADLENTTIAVSSGSTQEQEAQEIPGAKVQTYGNATLALTDVANGRADVYIGSRAVGSYLAAQRGLSVGPVEGSLSSETNAIAVPKGEDEFLAAMDAALAAMIDDGTFSEISQEWFGGLDMAAEFPEELAAC